MRSVRFYETAQSARNADFSDCCVIVIDVLRATSSIVTALYYGAREVLPVKSPEQAFAIADKEDSILLCGERQGKSIKGFNLGNSPLEYQSDEVREKILVMTTTNGTRALVNASKTDCVVLLAFLNMKAVSRFVQSTDKDIVLLCAGTNGEFSIDDAVCAGLFARQLSQHESIKFENPPDQLGELVERYQHNILDLLRDSHHGQYLIRLGFEHDLDFCARRDIYDIVPSFKNDRVSL